MTLHCERYACFVRNICIAPLFNLHVLALQFAVRNSYLFIYIDEVNTSWVEMEAIFNMFWKLYLEFVSFVAFKHMQSVSHS
jgi:hypothetical protein